MATSYERGLSLNKKSDDTDLGLSLPIRDHLSAKVVKFAFKYRFDRFEYALHQSSNVVPDNYSNWQLFFY